MKKILSYTILLISLSVSAQKTYQKNHFDDGVLKSEGWLKKIKKTVIGNSIIKTESLKKRGVFK